MPWLATATVEAWDGRNPGSIRVLLSNPRWEMRLLRFFGLRRTVERGLDVEEVHAAKTVELTIWEAEEEGRDAAGDFHFLFVHQSSTLICKGAHTLRSPQAHGRGGGFPMSRLARRQPVSYDFPLSIYPTVAIDLKQTNKQTNKQPR